MRAGVVPEVVHLHDCQVSDLERCVCYFAEFRVLQIQCTVHSLLKKFFFVELLQNNLSTVSSSFQRNFYLILITLIRLKTNQLLEHPLFLRHKLYTDGLAGIPLKVESSWRDGEEPHIQFVCIVAIKQGKLCIPSSILQHYLLLDDIAHPAMPACYGFRPVDLAPLPLSHNRYPYHSFPGNHHQLVLVVAKRSWSEADSDDNGHSWRDIPAILLGVFDGCDDELLLFEGGDFDPLYVFGVVDEPHLRLVDVHGVVVGEGELFGVNPEVALGGVGGEGGSIAEGVIEVAGVASEGDLAVHAVGYLLVLYGLLDVELGQLGRFAHRG